MWPHSPSGKFRRAEEIFTPDQRRIMKWLVDNGYGIESVMERFGLSEDAAITLVKRTVPHHEPQWQVRWDDAAGERHVKVCESFSAAKTFHAALKDVEWSRIERV